MRTAARNFLLFVLLGGAFSFYLDSSSFAQELAQTAAIASLGAAGVAQTVKTGKELEEKTEKVLLDNKIHTEKNQPTTIAPMLEKTSEKQVTEINLISSSKNDLGAGITTANGEEKNEDSPVKIPESIKGVIKRLNAETNEISLEDLNSAREAVAKLDMLIDIEKRLNDLADLRKEREEKLLNSLESSIPDSVFGHQQRKHGPFYKKQGDKTISEPPPYESSLQQTSSPQLPLAVSSPDVSVQRIIGSSGKYTAIIKFGGEEKKVVREGDKLSDGSVVKEITNQGIILVRGKERRTIKIKDINIVLNNK